MTRALGIDYGDSRIGLSLSDPMRIIAKPYKTIKNSSETISEIREITKENDVGHLVVGYPINMKGEKTIQTKKVDEFIDTLEKSFDFKVTKIDERLSSTSAIQSLVKQGIKTGHNKSKIDDTSAAIILQEFLDMGA